MYHFKSDFPRKSEASSEKILFRVFNIHIKNSLPKYFIRRRACTYTFSILKFDFLESNASNEKIFIVYFHGSRSLSTSDFIIRHLTTFLSLYGESKIRNGTSTIQIRFVPFHFVTRPIVSARGLELAIRFTTNWKLATSFHENSSQRFRSHIQLLGVVSRRDCLGKLISCQQLATRITKTEAVHITRFALWRNSHSRARYFNSS